jgi:hypothetical protein
MKTFSTISTLASLMLLVSGCNTQVITGEAADRLRYPYPYGARWVKEGMTRESRKADWVTCGGGVDLSNGFRQWITTEPWSTFNAERERHEDMLNACIQSKGYDYKNPALRDVPDECDARTCMYP